MCVFKRYIKVVCSVKLVYNDVLQLIKQSRMKDLILIRSVKYIMSQHLVERNEMVPSDLKPMMILCYKLTFNV